MPQQFVDVMFKTVLELKHKIRDSFEYLNQKIMEPWNAKKKWCISYIIAMEMTAVLVRRHHFMWNNRLESSEICINHFSRIFYFDVEDLNQSIIQKRGSAAICGHVGIRITISNLRL